MSNPIHEVVVTLSTLRFTGLAATLVVVAALAACSQATAPELLAQAKQALEKSDAKAAQLHLKSALQLDGQLAEARFLLGKILLEAGDAQGALVELGKAAEAGFPLQQMAELHARALLERRESRKLIETYGDLELKDPKAQAGLLIALGEAQMRLDLAAEARASFERAARLQPDDGRAEVELARLEANAGRHDQALARIDALLSKQSSLVAAWRLKGDLEALHKRNPAAARQAYERAAKEGPKSVDAQMALVGFLLSERDVAGAEKQLAAARAQIGAVAGVRYFSAVIDMEQGRLDAAFEQVQQLLKAAPEDVRVLFLAGQIEFLRDRFLQAESQLTRALSLRNNPRTRMLLAQTYLRLDDPARAVQALQPLLEEQGRNARVHALAGEAYMMLGESRKAEEQFKRAAELDPKDTRSRTLLALGQVGQGQDARGLSELRELSESFESPIADLALVGTFIRKGDFEAALKAIDAIERKLPDRGLAPSMRAQVFRAQGKPVEARAALQDALKRDPKYLPAALQLARLDLAAKQPEQAVAQLAAVVKADPSNVASKLAWFNIRMQAGEPAEKLEGELRELIKQQPQVSRSRLALVRLQLRRGDVAGAAASAQEAVAALPTESELYEQLAEVQVRQRDFTLAVKSLQKLAELRPRAPEALVRLAEVELLAGRQREALVSVRKALALRATHGPALRMQVMLEAELGNLAAARRLVKDMQQLPGLEALASAAEGDLESSQQQYGVAVSAYRRALARNAALPEVPAKLHRVLRAAGKQDEADAFARDWFKDHPRDVALINYLGDIALAQNRLAEARQHYERSLGLAAEQALVLNNLAWIAVQQGDAQRAEAWVREALRIAPGEAALHDTQSAYLALAGQHEQALAAQRRALSLDANPAYRVGLARRLIVAGRKDAARDELQAVQQLGDRYPGQAEVSDMLTKL